MNRNKVIMAFEAYKTEIAGLKSQLAYEVERNANNVANADLQIAELKAQLAAAQAEVERLRNAYNDQKEQIATLCERLAVGTGLDGKTYAVAIRGIGYGGRLAAQQAEAERLQSGK
jgi:uncharacterized small protein (DUF1192 family)